MKIAIISDIHENFHNLILALQAMEQHQIDQIICLGDLMNSGIAKLLATQVIPVYMIWGNNDGEKVEIVQAALQEKSNLTVSTNTYDFLERGERNIFITHYDDLAIPMAQSGEYDAVFYGHNHMEAVDQIGDCWVVNPGEIAASKTKRSTFAIYDTEENTVDKIELQNTITLKTPLMEAYFKEHGEKMGLRSNKAFSLEDTDLNIIPVESAVFHTLREAALSAKAVVFSGLPGVGKSLYINQFMHTAASEGRQVTVIQWDVARKAFETPLIKERFPMGAGIVHDGVKLAAGAWLMATIKDWLESNQDEAEILLIEAPLVGHRFIELAMLQEDERLESFLSSSDFQVICPIPSSEVRAKIEADRAAQIAEDAQVWSGAKASVMLMLWKRVCGIANEFGRNIPMDAQPPYDPEVYEFVFQKILKHRHFKPLHIDEIFKVHIVDEAALHQAGSLQTDPDTADQFARMIMEQYTSDQALSDKVNRWYLT